MEPAGVSTASLVITASLAQVVYYTVLMTLLAVRLSSRLAVMEFKVNALWSKIHDGDVRD